MDNMTFTISGMASSSAVEQTENRLLQLFLDRGYNIGDALPKELDLTEELGVARSVLREALSRLRMMGLIETRPRRGMILAEPSFFGGMSRIFDPHFFTMDSLLQLLELRISLEIGIAGALMERITDEQIEDLMKISNMSHSLGLNTYPVMDEYAFHERLYKLSGNQMLIRFQSILHLVLTYIHRECEEDIEQENEWLARQGLLVSHEDILLSLRTREKAQVYLIMERHFAPYRNFIAKKRIQNR